MKPLKSRIEEILQLYLADTRKYPVSRRAIHRKSIDSLLTLFREAMENCIGDDEPESDMKTNDFAKNMELAYLIARNGLREEQREKIQEVTK